MTKKEYNNILQEHINIYSGILYNNQTFKTGNNNQIVYKFDCPEFETLKNKYKLEEIAGNGTDYKKAKRLLHYLAPKLTHSSWYDNHVPCNALDLLEYSLDNPQQGINCLNKSKILEECCLSLGIYARKVSLIPYSPYDFDNHVVVEIFDRKLNKWIMMDPSTDGLFVDENSTPLSILEIRDKFANYEFVTYVRSTDSLKNLQKLRDKHAELNAYICKNLFYFCVDKDSTFGTTGNILTFVPNNYSIKANLIANTQYRINNLPEEYKDFITKSKNKLKKLKDYQENESTNIDCMTCSPIDNK